MVVALMLMAVCLAIVIACVLHARSEGWKALGLRSLKRSRALPTPLPDDMPPAGLTPLVPTPRAMASEFERGLRELTLFLAVEARD